MQLLFVPLISAVLHKKQAGNAGVTVAAMGRTWFFNQARLQYSLTLIAALRSYSLSGLLSPGSVILAFFFIRLSSLCSKMPEIWATERTLYFIIQYFIPLS